MASRYLQLLDQDATDWKEMNFAYVLGNRRLTNFDGIVWFRKKINIPATWVGHDITLNLGTVNDDDLTFFNGTEVGKTSGWNKARTYTIPSVLIKARRNVIAVSVKDNDGSGGIYGKARRFEHKLQ
jgi:sialate O-acetylesterase